MAKFSVTHSGYGRLEKLKDSLRKQLEEGQTFGQEAELSDLHAKVAKVLNTVTPAPRDKPKLKSKKKKKK